jgi:hypothetical protein
MAWIGGIVTIRGTIRRLLTRSLILVALFRGVSVQSCGSVEPSEAPIVGDPAAHASFEGVVRPILEERCQACHAVKKSKGDPRLDSRAAIVAGGESGPANVPGDPKEGRLIDAVNYGDLLDPPRRHPALGFNESILGTGRAQGRSVREAGAGLIATEVAATGQDEGEPRLQSRSPNAPC